MDLLQYVDNNLKCICNSNKTVIECCKNNKKYDLKRFCDCLFDNLNNYNHLKNNKCCINFFKKKCIYKPIRSHTISRTRYLSNISTEGFVYNFHYNNFHTFMNNDSKSKLSKININNASIFIGLCSKHDKLYNPIDNEFELKDKNNYFLLSQRQLLMEIDSIKKQINHNKLIDKYIHSIKKNILILSPDYYEVIDFIKKMENALSERTIEANKKLKKINQILNIYSNNEKNKLSFINFEINSKLPFATSQILTYDENNSFLYLSVLPLKNSTLAIFVYLKDDINRARDISEINKQNIIPKLLTYALKHHNSYYSCNMIDSLNSKTIDDITILFNESVKNYNFEMNIFMDIDEIPENIEYTLHSSK